MSNSNPNPHIPSPTLASFSSSSSSSSSLSSSISSPISSLFRHRRTYFVNDSPPDGAGALAADDSPSQSLYAELIRSVKDITAGTIGGVMTVLVGHPLDTLKVRLQAAPTGSYNGFWDVTLKTWKMEGIRGYYKGMQSPLAGEGFFNAAQFLAWGRAKALLHNPNTDLPNELSVPRYFLAGAFTGFFSTFVECPVDFFKSQLQTQVLKSELSTSSSSRHHSSHSYPPRSSFFSLVQSVYHTNGFPGFYQGLLATFSRSVPASCVYFGFYELIRGAAAERLRREGNSSATRSDIGAAAVLLAGGVGGVMYWATTYPVDSVKSAIQADSYVKEERKYKGMVDCARQFYREGGIARFYRGIVPCLLRSFPANAACFWAYELALQAMG